MIRKKTSDQSRKLYSMKKWRKVTVDLQILSKKYKFTIFTRINQTPKEFASIDFGSKTDLYNFVISEKVVFMFKTRPVHVIRSAPGTSQNVGAVNGDDDDGKRDCGGDKGSHGHGGSRGDSKTSSHVGQG